ncbi:MAG: hypothetical protein WEB19_01280 [Acidimicrobiia bacterium]
MRKGVKRVLGLGLLAGAGYAVWRAMEKSRADSGLTWQPRPFPYPPEPHQTETHETAPVAAETVAPWVNAADGACPADYPVKAKLASGIFHEPGGANYTRTQADRCYSSSEAAIADGLRPSKR